MAALTPLFTSIGGAAGGLSGLGSILSVASSFIGGGNDREVSMPNQVTMAPATDAPTVPDEPARVMSAEESVKSQEDDKRRRLLAQQKTNSKSNTLAGNIQEQPKTGSTLLGG
jgi:hypothetical protein